MTDGTTNLTTPNEWVVKLADIALPAPPDWQPVTLYGGAAIIITALFMAGGAWYRCYRRRRTAPTRRSAALQRLEHLYRQWHSGAAADRETAYRLAAILRLGLGLQQLNEEYPAGFAADPQWRETMQLLETQRYETRPADRLHPEVFDRARRWLRQEIVTGQAKPC